jgi:hypothetical protein
VTASCSSWRSSSCSSSATSTSSSPTTGDRCPSPGLGGQRSRVADRRRRGRRGRRATTRTGTTRRHRSRPRRAERTCDTRAPSRRPRSGPSMTAEDPPVPPTTSPTLAGHLPRPPTIARVRRRRGPAALRPGSRPSSSSRTNRSRSTCSPRSSSTTRQVLAELEALAAEYLEAGRGMEIRRAAGGWRMYSAALARPAVERWALAGTDGAPDAGRPRDPRRDRLQAADQPARRSATSAG